MDQWSLGMAAVAGPMLGGVWYSSRYAWWRPTVSWKWPRILMYHMVRPHRSGTRFNGLRVAPEQFEAQVRWLSESGWTFLKMEQLVANWGRTADKTVAITFDDGFQDNLTHALPILRKYNAPATLYLVRDRFGVDWSTKKKSHHNSNELGEEPKLSDRQVRQMLDTGLVELGSHTLTHANLAMVSAAEKKQELAASKTSFEETFQVPVTSFAYPFGIYSESDVTLAKECGYTNAVTTDPGINQCLNPGFHQLRRIKISGREGISAFKLRLRTGWRAWNK